MRHRQSQPVAALIAAVVGAAGIAGAQPCEPAWVGGMSAPNGPVHAITVWDEPGGIEPGVYIAGDFRAIGSMPAEHVARWDGARWHPVGELTDLEVRALTAAVVGGGMQLIAGGRNTTGGPTDDELVWVWDGSSWMPVEDFSGRSGAINALARFSIQLDAALVAGGRTGLRGSAGTLYSYGGRWDLRLQGQEVLALATWTDPNQVRYLVAGGREPDLNRQHVGLARVDEHGDSEPMGDMLDWTVTALATPNPRIIYAARQDASGTVHEVVRWSGQVWEPIAPRNDFDGPVRAMAFFDPDGGGPMPVSLIAGGEFSRAGSADANNLAAWDGHEWRALGPGKGTDGPVLALQPADFGRRLFAGGEFTESGGVNSPNLARRDTCFCYADCDESTGAGTLDIFDFLCFQDAFASGDPRADCDGTGMLNILDFLCFQDAFALGCP